MPPLIPLSVVHAKPARPQGVERRAASKCRVRPPAFPLQRVRLVPIPARSASRTRAIATPAPAYGRGGALRGLTRAPDITLRSPSPPPCGQPVAHPGAGGFARAAARGHFPLTRSSRGPTKPPPAAMEAALLPHYPLGSIACNLTLDAATAPARRARAASRNRRGTGSIARPFQGLFTRAPLPVPSAVPVHGDRARRRASVGSIHRASRRRRARLPPLTRARPRALAPRSPGLGRARWMGRARPASGRKVARRRTP